MFHLPEQALPVDVMVPAADAGGRTGSYIQLKNALRVYLVYYMNQGNAATVALAPQQAVDSSGTSAKAINTVPVFTNQDMAAAEAFTRQTDAASFTTSAAVKHKCVVFEIDPARALDLANSFYWIAPQTGASNAANITSCIAIVVPRFEGKTPGTFLS